MNIVVRKTLPGLKESRKRPAVVEKQMPIMLPLRIEAEDKFVSKIDISETDTDAVLWGRACEIYYHVQNFMKGLKKLVETVSLAIENGNQQITLGWKDFNTDIRTIFRALRQLLPQEVSS